MPDLSPPSSPSDAPAPRYLALVRDLLFATKISSTARTLGREITMVRDPLKLCGHAGTVLIVDLNLDGAIEAAAGWMRATTGRVIGFVSHVDAETIGRARAAGITDVMPRSQFVRILPELLAEDCQRD